MARDLWIHKEAWHPGVDALAGQEGRAATDGIEELKPSVDRRENACFEPLKAVEALSSKYSGLCNRIPERHNKQSLLKQASPRRTLLLLSVEVYSKDHDFKVSTLTVSMRRGKDLDRLQFRLRVHRQRYQGYDSKGEPIEDPRTQEPTQLRCCRSQ